MKEDKYRVFVVRLLSLSFAFSLLIILLNWIVDPLQTFEMPQKSGFNLVKTEVNSQTRLYKALEIARLKPKAIFLGSSRVMIGLDPSDLAPFSNELAFNAAFAGANFEELYEYFEHTLYHQPDLKVVVIGLDFFAFNKNKKDEFDLKTLNLKKPVHSLESCTTLLFTKTITLNSLNTVKKNLLDKPVIIFLPDGFLNFELVKDPSTNEVLKIGEEKFMSQLLNSKKWYKDFQLCEKRIALFQKMTDICRDKGIALHIFINPCKAIYWNRLMEANLWDLMEEWKRKISAIHPVWDFSGFNKVTTGEPQDLWYLDCSHYKPHVGNLIISSFYGKPSFGFELTPETVEQSLIHIRSDYDAWINKKNDAEGSNK